MISVDEEVLKLNRVQKRVREPSYFSAHSEAKDLMVVEQV